MNGENREQLKPDENVTVPKYQMLMEPGGSGCFPFLILAALAVWLIANSK